MSKRVTFGVSSGRKRKEKREKKKRKREKKKRKREKKKRKKGEKKRKREKKKRKKREKGSSYALGVGVRGRVAGDLRVF